MTLTIVKQDAPTLVIGVGAFDSAAGAAIMASHTAFGLTLDASANAAEGRSVLQITDFATRAQFITWQATATVVVGHIVHAAGLGYIYKGSGGVTDATAWHPLWDTYPDHWAENLTPGTTSMSAAIAAADSYCATNGGILKFTAKNYKCDTTQIKDESTFWEGQFTNAASGGIGTTLNIAYNGAAFTVTGTNTNYQGGIKGIRVLGDRTLYPEAIGFDMVGVNDHFFDNCYMGNLKFGVRGQNCRTLNFNWFYGFGMLESSVRLYGDTQVQSSDHCFIECQFAGDIYGIDIENSTAIQIRGCRPQVSGVANGRFHNVTKLTIADGFCDSSKVVSGADGFILSNCTRVNIDNNQFYSNGTGSADIWIVADDAITSDIIITNNQFDLGTSVTRTGVSFVAPIGTGSIRRINISSNNFTGMTTAVAGASNILTELKCDSNHGIDTYVGVAGPVADFTYDHFADVTRITGTLGTSFNVNIPNGRAYKGDRLTLVRVNAGAGIVTLLGPNGATVGTLSGAGKLEAVCIQASTTPGSTSYVAI